MHKFRAKHGNRVQTMLVHKDMQLNEFTEALCYTMELPDGHIVGFRDHNGKYFGDVG